MSRHPSKQHAILGLDESVRLHSLPVVKPVKEGALSFSDYFSPEVPYEVKPVPMVRPMEEKKTMLRKIVKDIVREMLKRKKV